MHTIILGLLFACNSQETANSNKEVKKDEGSFGQLNVEDLKKAAKEVDLVPSPLKMKEEFKKKGLEANLSTYVQKKDFKMDITDKDQLALRAGVLLCDLVLTVETAPAADSIQNLEALKIGFNGLGAGGDIAATIDELIDTLKGENPNKGALLSDMDDLSQVMVPELKYEAGEWVVPLIQAGSWLEGANLVSAAIK
ncbi:MAG: hypothetical protein VX278_21130, partial [Myxococcota bacterium]|nr:hypothetical protein [Myxococcota bacterium]